MGDAKYICQHQRQLLYHIHALDIMTLHSMNAKENASYARNAKKRLKAMNAMKSGRYSSTKLVR